MFLLTDSSGFLIWWSLTWCMCFQARPKDLKVPKRGFLFFECRVVIVFCFLYIYRRLPEKCSLFTIMGYWWPTKNNIESWIVLHMVFTLKSYKWSLFIYLSFSNMTTAKLYADLYLKIAKHFYTEYNLL